MSFRPLIRSTALTLTVALSACATLPRDVDVEEAYAGAPAVEGVLAEVAGAIELHHGPDQSGFWLLDRNADALKWRLALIDSAVSSLDVAYYLWYGDDSGRLLLKRLIRAAERGVEVRLLVDDLLLIGNEKALVALDAHPNIDLRLFNPKRQRRLGMLLDTLLRFSEMNSRMHNKLIVADNRAVILGGRNIGDHYFGLNSRYNFHDLDVLGFGPVALESSELFDNFWNGPWSVPAGLLPVSVSEEERERRFEKLLEELRVSEKLETFPLGPSDWSAELHELSLGLRIGRSQTIYDRFDNGNLERRMIDPLGNVLRAAEERIDIVNAYIIPEQDFIDGIQRITQRGVSVRILTNSLSSHDVPAVNSHYRQWRQPLLEAGAELFEFRADPTIKTRIDTAPVVSGFSALHTKAFVVDARQVFIGSMNFDPRSAAINTEMGILIDSEALGADVLQLAERDMGAANAWRVGLDPDGELIWTNDLETARRQPARNAWQRFMDGFFRILPKSQL